MRVKLLLTLLVLFVVSLTTSYSYAQTEEAKKAETIICPVSGEEVLKSKAIGPYTYKGTDYYFGCDNCLEKFKADPEKYLNRVRDFNCGMMVDKRTAIKLSYEGKDYYFCSDNCKVAFEKDPKAAIEKMKEECKKKEHKCSHEYMKEKSTSSEKKSGCCAKK